MCHYINLDKENLLASHEQLGFPTMEVTKQTLLNTMQMLHTLEAEAHEYMRDHFQAHLRLLPPHCINDTLFTDMFFSSVMSVYGYDKFQMFSFYHCKVDIGKLIRYKSQAVGELQDIVREVGAPNYIVRAFSTIGNKYPIPSIYVKKSFSTTHHKPIFRKI